MQLSCYNQMQVECLLDAVFILLLLPGNSCSRAYIKIIREGESSPLTSLALRLHCCPLRLTVGPHTRRLVGCCKTILWRTTATIANFKFHYVKLHSSENMGRFYTDMSTGWKRGILSRFPFAVLSCFLERWSRISGTESGNTETDKATTFPWGGRKGG